MRGSPITWLLSPLAHVVLSDAESSEGFLMSRDHPPLLMIHAKDDPVVPFAAGEELFHIATNPKKFWIVDKPGHLALYWCDDGKPNVENRKRLLLEIGL